MAQRVLSYVPAPLEQTTTNTASTSYLPSAYSAGNGSAYAYSSGTMGAGQYASTYPGSLGPGLPQLQASPAPGTVQLPGFDPAQAMNQPQLQAQSLTSGHACGGGLMQGPSLPNPNVIQKQKDGYIRLLDEQLKQGQQTLDSQRKQQSEYLYQQADQQKRQVEMQMKQQVQAQETQLMQQYNQARMQVQQSASEQKSALETQAMQLTMEYQQKASQEQMHAKQHELQRQHVQAQMKFAAEMQKLQTVSGAPSPPSSPVNAGGMPGGSGQYGSGQF